MATCGKAAGTRDKMRSHARKEASAQEVRGYFKLLKQNISITDLRLKTRFFDLIDMRKVRPRNYVTGRWVLTIKTDKRGKFLGAKAIWVLGGFQDKQIENLQTDSHAST